ncbi:dormancy-associated protein homolog 4-like [Momordica charantia]|uniref:Dormancy-associated protein homolog 4-like n=1 Tax=Momordica charantia TaxID=3673 RepID=A0A6J1D3F2_MOMCH|nr:dormancy-associated protein homolog 4-like [Momordica charantia]
MSFLQNIWDETLAGPPPDSALGRLRKYNSFAAHRSPPMTISIPSPTTLSHTHDSRPPPTPPPVTPRDDDIKRLITRRRSLDFPRPLELPDRTTPSVYDWIVITALDR